MRPRIRWQRCAGSPDDGRLYCGDNMDFMQTLPDESIHLIYADPPFFSGKTYRHRAGVFDDSWPGGLEDYLSWLLQRLKEMKRLLVPGGTLYVHLDWHAVHHVKVALDKLFGPKNFLNEIIWAYSAGGRSKRFWSRKHDTILYYVKGPGWTFNADAVRVPYASDMTRWSYKRGRMQGRDMPRGKVPEDVFTDVQLNTMAKERTGYPTQKPASLLQRLILASSDRQDVIADFFAGSGTSLVVAQRTGRKWLGADSAPAAVALTWERLGQRGQIERGSSYQWLQGEWWQNPLSKLVALPPGWRLCTENPKDDSHGGNTFYCTSAYDEGDRTLAGRRGLKGFDSQLALSQPYPLDEVARATGAGGNAHLWPGPEPCIEADGTERLLVRPKEGETVHWWMQDEHGCTYELHGPVLSLMPEIKENGRISCLVVDEKGAGAVRRYHLTQRGGC